MKSGEAVPKNPYIVSNADWTSWAFMKVDIPLFSDGTDSVSLLNLSDNWKLLKDEVNGSVHTKIYGYKTRLAGGNSKRLESDRAKTDSLFDSFKACNTSADKPFIGSLNVCGTLVQSDDTDDLAKIVERAEFDDSAASEAIFRISYDLDDGTLTGQKYLYTKDDYGYTPPIPVKDGFVFNGWSPASIPDGSTGDITFTSSWTPNILTINYHSSSASKWEDPDGTTINIDPSKDVIVHTDKIAYDGDYSPDSTHSANAGLLDTNRLKKTGYHAGNFWKTDAGKEVSDQADMTGYKGSNVADFLGVLPEFKTKNTTVDIHTDWTANTYIIKYNANAPTGATSNGSMADTGCTYDESKTLSANTYSINSYYSFLSWNTKANGSGTSYANGATVKNLTSENNGTITLYAQWKLAAKSWDFNYTGGVQSWTCPATGTYKLETWGAQAGYDGFSYENRNADGAQGGHVSGTINLTKGTTLYICVGGRGGGNYGGLKNEYYGGAGGYNGGGNGGTGYYFRGSGNYIDGGGGGSGGGGATHIATTNRGVLSNYASNQNEVLIVAGGGGGCAYGINGATGGDGNTTYQFGQGQAGNNGRSNAHEGGGGGGGGWYGGAYGSDDRANSAGMAPAYGGTNHINSKLSSQVSQRGGRNGNGLARITAVR